MNEMVCRDCGARFYSAAASALVRRGDACAECGGELELGVAEAGPVEHARVGGGGSGHDNGGNEGGSKRRFDR